MRSEATAAAEHKGESKSGSQAPGMAIQALHGVYHRGEENLP